MANPQQKQDHGKAGQGDKPAIQRFGKWDEPVTRPPWSSPPPEMASVPAALKGVSPLDERLRLAAEQKGRPLTEREADDVANTFALGQRNGGRKE